MSSLHSPTRVDWDNVEDPRTCKLIKAASLIDASIAHNARVMIQGIDDPRKTWHKLELWAAGSGPVQYSALLTKLNTTTSSNYKTVQEYITAFEGVQRDLKNLGRTVKEVEYTTQFIVEAVAQYPKRADRIRGTLRLGTMIHLDVAMADLRDEAALKGSQKVAESNFQIEQKDRRKRGNGKKGKKATTYKRGECPHKMPLRRALLGDHPDKRPQWKVDADAKEAKDSKEFKRSKEEESNITEHCFHTEAVAVSALWPGDSGSTCHISNNRREFASIDENVALPAIRTGAGFVYPQGRGTIKKIVRAGDQWKILTFRAVYYCPGFSKIILSLQLIYAVGGYDRRLKLYLRNDEFIATFDESFMLVTDFCPRNRNGHQGHQSCPLAP